MPRTTKESLGNGPCAAHPAGEQTRPPPGAGKTAVFCWLLRLGRRAGAGVTIAATCLLLSGQDQDVPDDVCAVKNQQACSKQPARIAGGQRWESAFQTGRAGPQPFLQPGWKSTVSPQVFCQPRRQFAALGQPGRKLRRVFAEVTSDDVPLVKGEACCFALSPVSVSAMFFIFPATFMVASALRIVCRPREWAGGSGGSACHDPQAKGKPGKCRHKIPHATSSVIAGSRPRKSAAEYRVQHSV